VRAAPRLKTRNGADAIAWFPEVVRGLAELPAGDHVSALTYSGVDEKKLRILVADDNVDAATSLAMLMELSGYDVRGALDGNAAVRLAEQWTPDAAIFDINLPGLDGYEVTRMLRHRFSQEIVLLALSGQLSGRPRDLATLVLFDVCCAKGADFIDVETHLDALLRAQPPHARRR